MSKKSELAALLLCALLAAPVAAQEQEVAPATEEVAPEETTEEAIARWMNLGENYTTGKGRFIVKDYQKAASAFAKAAKLGSGEAYYRLGNIYFNGEGDIDADEFLGLHYYRKAAELGQGDAQMIIGVQFVMDGIEQKPNSPAQKLSYVDAVKWLQRAAEQDIAEAKYWYGDMLIKGLGTKQDVEKGRRLIKESAEAGNPNGQAMYAALLWQAQAGLQKNLVGAYKWMYLAARGGNESAPILLRRIAGEMNADELAAAKQAVDAVDANQKKPTRN